MEVYLVGGAVRDELLGLPVQERDWVVVGGTAKGLLDQGYRRVGRNFPVFLHPATHEEYALARTERKTAAGHTGFVTDTGPEVTLKADLARRDLTINAMAKDQAGRLIDPFGGRQDLHRRCLRHVTEAFAEDPLRVFRVARFAASLDGFSVHPETLAFMAGMAAALAELPAERVWREFHKALDAPAPQRFIEVLEECRCLLPWLPELSDATVDPDLAGALQRYSGLGWTLAPAALQTLGKRLRAPSAFVRLSLDIARHGHLLGAWEDAETAALDRALRAINAYRDQDRRRRAFAVIGVKSGRAMNELDQALAHLEQEMAAMRSGWLRMGEAEMGRRLHRVRLSLLARFQRQHR